MNWFGRGLNGVGRRSWMATDITSRVGRKEWMARGIMSIGNGLLCGLVGRLDYLEKLGFNLEC